MSRFNFLIDGLTITYDPTEPAGFSGVNPNNPTRPVQVIPSTTGRVLALSAPGEPVIGHLVRVLPDGTAEVDILEEPARRPDEVTLQSAVELKRRSLDERMQTFTESALHHYRLLRTRGVAEADAAESAINSAAVMLLPELAVSVEP